MPIRKKVIDMDNLYDHKRMQDPMYSDLFDQCITTGGKKPSPIRKKHDDIVASGAQWNSQGLEQKVRKDYTGYKPKQEKLKEFYISTQRMFK